MVDDSELGSGVSVLAALSKAETGIPGLDDVTGGGLPRGRTTLLCGGPGCGKTLMAMQFLVRGAMDAGEPGVFVAFEESSAELAQNVSSLGHGLEEYVSDCVVLLDHRVHDQISTRRLRVVKYRGSDHGPDQYPFLIDRRGFSVLAVSSMALDHQASAERVSMGVGELDRMLDGGAYRGSSVLISGTPGSGKTTLGARFLEARCERGERGMLFAFEESPSQIARNMRSVGIDVQRGSMQGCCGSCLRVRRRMGWRRIWRGCTRRSKSSRP